MNKDLMFQNVFKILFSLPNGSLNLYSLFQSLLCLTVFLLVFLGSTENIIRIKYNHHTNMKLELTLALSDIKIPTAIEIQDPNMYINYSNCVVVINSIYLIDSLDKY